MNTYLTKKIVAGVTALTCAVMMAGPLVQAQTSTDLQAQIDLLLQQLSALQGQLGTLEGTTGTTGATGATGATAAITGIPAGFTFENNLKLGMSGDEVKYLQIVLNADSATQVAASGVGSAGYETVYFGPLTKAAVVKFQEKYATECLAPYGLTSGTGFVGKTTRAQLNVVLGAGVTTPTTPVTKTPEEIINATECVAAGYEWYTSACHAVGGTTEPTTPTTPTVKQPGEITNATECVTAGYEWYTSACHAVGGTPTTPTTPTTAAGLTVALASDTPAAAAVASGTSYNKFLRLNLTAGSSDVSVTGIKITKGGISQNTAVVGVGVFDKDGARHGNIISSFTADNTATVSFASNPITVPAGTSVAVDIKLNITTAAAGQSGTIYVKIAAAGDITTTAEITGTFPVVGNVMSLVNGTNTVGTVRTDAFTHTAAANQAVDIGTVDQIIGKYTIAESGSNEDVKISKVTLYNNGNMADTDLANIDFVDQNGNILATADATVGKYVTFTLAEAYTIPKGNSRVFTVRADVVNGSTRTAQFIVQNDYDLEIVGVSSGSGILATTTGNTVDTTFPIGDAANLNTIVANQGTLSVARNSGTASGTVIAGSSNQSLLKVDLTANGEDFEFRQLRMTITDGGTIELSGTLIIKTTDGTTIYSETASTYTTAIARDLTLSSYLTIPAGTTKTIEVTASIASTATSSDSYRVTLTNWYGKRLTSNTFLGPQASPITGNTITVGAGGLSVSKNSAMANAVNVVAGSSDVKIASFVFKATSTENVNVTGITISGTPGATDITLANGYSNLKLKKENGTQLGATIPSPTGADTFSVSNFTVASGASEIVDVFVTISSSGTDTNALQAGISAVTAIGVTSQSSVTASGLTALGQGITVGLGGVLTVALDSTSTASAALVHAGEIGLPVLTAKFTANNFEDITINDITVAIQNGNANVSKASLYSGTSLVGGPVSIVGGEASFTNINKLVAKNKTISLTVKVDSTASGVMRSALVTKAGIVYVKATGAGGLISYPYVAGSEGVVAALTATGLANTYAVGDVVIFKDNSADVDLHEIGMITTAGSGATAAFFADNKDAAVTAAASDFLLNLPVIHTETATAATGVVYSYAIGDPVVWYDVAAVVDGDPHLGIIAAVTPTIHIDANEAHAIANTDVISKLPFTQTETIAANAFSNSYGIGDVAVYYDESGTGLVDLAMYTAAGVMRWLDTDTAIVETTGDIVTTLPKVHSETVSATADKYYYVGDPVVIYDAGTGVFLGVCTTAGYADTAGAARFTRNTGGAAILVAGDIVTKIKGFGAVGNSMRMYDVEPVVTLASSSPTGTKSPQAIQDVAVFDVKADGDVDLELSAIRLTKSGTNSPYHYVEKLHLYNGNTLVATDNSTTVAAVADDTAGLTVAVVQGGLEFCTGTGGAGAAGEVTGISAEEFASIQVGDKLVFSDGTDEITATVATKPAAVSANDNGALAANLTFSNVSQTTGAAAVSAAATAFSIYNYMVHFDANQADTSDKALALQTVTSGNTISYTVKADTSNVKTGVTTQAVTFGVYVNGTAGSTGDLTWQFDPISGTANTSGGTFCDNYPIYGNTLSY